MRSGPITFLRKREAVRPILLAGAAVPYSGGYAILPSERRRGAAVAHPVIVRLFQKDLTRLQQVSFLKLS